MVMTPDRTVLTGREAPATRIERYFTRPGVHPFDEVAWERRRVRISDESRQAVFEQDDVVVWSGVTKTAKGPVSRKLLQNISMGMNNSELDTSFPGPGKVYTNKTRFLESNLRAFYRSWLQNLVGGA